MSPYYESESRGGGQRGHSQQQMGSRDRYNDYDDNTQYSGSRNQGWDQDYDEGRSASNTRNQGRSSRSSEYGRSSDYDEDIPRRSTGGRQFTQSHTNWDEDYDDLGSQGRYANADRDQEENYSPSRRGSQRSMTSGSSSGSRRGQSSQSQQSQSGRRPMSSRSDRWDEDYDSEMDEGRLHAREDYEDEDFDEERYSRNNPSQY
ncbi:hypothetical protein [Bdellovibrio sp. NC01]|uniref:hypothetical protein n=1 Tax=Bdellovibrio sp. NC01 TaxID=2220073 RepID=UPI00143D04A4|nr:hypothetical protein [Bdellovibrio sp. NC01]